MKKIIFTIFISLFFLTGCMKFNSMEDIDIYTSIYPIEYFANRLYGDHSTVHSIYPDGIIYKVYTLNDKQLKDYSKSDLFIFNGLGSEKDYLKTMLKNNSNLKIIDATTSMEYLNYEEELWIDPSNALMIARNIKSGLSEYINNHYLKNQIEKNYESLKVDLSNLSAKLYLISENSSDSTIVVSSNAFKFLEKYGFNVISLEENKNNGKIINYIKSRIANGQTKNIFVLKDEELDDDIQNIINEFNINRLEFHTLSNINESERNSKKDYVSICLENINLLKQELYK